MTDEHQADEHQGDGWEAIPVTDEHQADEHQGDGARIAAGFREVSKVPATARAEARAEVGRLWRVMTVVNLAVVVAAAVAGAWYGQEVAADNAATRAEVSALRSAAEQVKPSGDQANRELTDQGRAPVPIPEPGTAPDADVITASVTARVLASIPAPEISPARLGQAIAEQMAASPPVVSSGALAASVAGYLQLNPPPPGKDGQPGADGQPGTDGAPGQSPPCMAEPDQCKGEKGDPPTAAEIEAAFAEFVTANPELLRDTLCAGLGTWQEVSLRSADGGTTSGFLCVVGTTDPIVSVPEVPSIPVNPR
ncbi:hypothetical protein L3Q67_00930 [Saccharothrix sp. AJ9571]|nr:hypothetical protein L3Q67_00930 [Saccharothrix sp. AJ9571]